MQGNLYTFGCSFAQYSWPMWPDILSQNYNVTKNYASPGCGNFYIFHKATDLLISNKVKNTDTVIIQWTEPNRTDYIDEHDGWAGPGSLTAELLTKAKLDFIISDKTSIIKTLIYMINIINLLETIGCKWYFMYMTPESIVHSFKNSQLFIDTNLYETYTTMVKKLLPYKHCYVDTVSMTDFYHDKRMPLKHCFHFVKNKLHSNQDDHPLPNYTLMYIKEIASLIIPDLNIIKMEEYVNEIMTTFDFSTQINLSSLEKKLSNNKKLINFKKSIDSRKIDE
jgi:hypothetical protein